MNDNYSKPNPYQYGFDNNNNFNPNNQFNPQNNESKTMAIIALVLSIIAFLGICFCIGLPFGIAALIISIIVLAKKKNGKGMAIAATIISSIAVLISAIMVAVIVPMYNDMIDFTMNLPEIVENYQEDGSLPDYLDEYREKYPEYFDSFMDGVIEEYEKNPEAFEFDNN